MGDAPQQPLTILMYFKNCDSYVLHVELSVTTEHKSLHKLPPKRMTLEKVIEGKEKKILRGSSSPLWALAYDHLSARMAGSVSRLGQYASSPGNRSLHRTRRFFPSNSRDRR